jgi:hypothetical protein
MVSLEVGRGAGSQHNETGRVLLGGLRVALVLFWFFVSKLTYKVCVVEARETGSYIQCDWFALSGPHRAHQRSQRTRLNND